MFDKNSRRKFEGRCCWEGWWRIVLKVYEQDLDAREAHYHEVCRKSYTRPNSSIWKSETDKEERLESAAHKETFTYLADYIEREIIRNSTITRVSILKEQYQTYLKQNHPQFFNPLYATQKLKNKILKHFPERVHFFKPKCGSEIVYSDELSTSQAVEFAFHSSASETRALENAALILRKKIMNKYSESSEISWPPTTEYVFFCICCATGAY